MSLPLPIKNHDGLAFSEHNQPIYASAHTGSVLRNLGDLLLTLPAHAVVLLSYDHPTGGVITFRAMARDIPFGHEAQHRYERRYTMLDSGGEFFLKSDETHRVIAVTLLGDS